MTSRKINLGTLSLLAGLLVEPATATAALCAPKPGGAALNLRESDFTIPTALRAPSGGFDSRPQPVELQ